MHDTHCCFEKVSALLAQVLGSGGRRWVGASLRLVFEAFGFPVNYVK